MLLSFAVQFWANWFTNSSLCRDTTWGCFKIRDTQKVNRSSEPLDLGAWKSWDTPGKLCLFTSPSYWGQFWVVYPPLWYESTLSNTPKTLRKVIPVKGWSKWANGVLDQAGQTLRWKIPGTKNGCMDHHAVELGHLTSDLFSFGFDSKLQHIISWHAGWVFGKLPKLQMWA